MHPAAKTTGRKSLRVKGYDYATAGVYFVTVCTYHRAQFFGRIEGAQMHLNALGRIVRHCWYSLRERFPSIELDAFIVMPNHIHGVVVLYKSIGAKPTLATVVQAFKSLSAIAVNRALGRTGRLWQRNYFEHVVRSGRAHDAIFRYIYENPARWQFDRENPFGHRKPRSGALPL